jgi:hypothetical protein
MAKTSHAKRQSISPPTRRAAPATLDAPPVASGRKFRGSAPWAARHAKKHAEEAEKRNLEPPRPGSARATLRTPEQAEDIKARITALHERLGRLRALKKRLPEQGHAAGTLLKEIRDLRLFEAKGYASFEAFVEREIDLGSKQLALRLIRIPEVFTEPAARELGLEALLAALDTLERAAHPPAKPLPRPPAGRSK